MEGFIVNNRTPPPAPSSSATRLDLGSLTARTDVAAPTQAIALPEALRAPAPSLASVSAPAAGGPATPSPVVGWPSGERERQRTRAERLNAARDEADLERIAFERRQRSDAETASARKRAHQRRMDSIAEAKAWVWLLFGVTCLLVLASTGFIVARILLGDVTPPWMVR